MPTPCETLPIANTLLPIIVKELGPIDRRKPIYMTFGKPITVQGNGKEEHSDIVEFIASHIEHWEEEA